MIAAFNAVRRIDDYAFTPEQSISHGITTFVAQNRGGRQEGTHPEGIQERPYAGGMLLGVYLHNHYIVQEGRLWGCCNGGEMKELWHWAAVTWD